MEQITRDDAVHLIEDSVNAERGTVRGTETLEEIAWDSLASVSFIGFVDERLGRELDAKIVAKCKTVPDLLAILMESA
jgi:acyl carrier protein